MCVSMFDILTDTLVNVPLTFVFGQCSFPKENFFTSTTVVPVILPSLMKMVTFVFLCKRAKLVPGTVGSLFKLSRIPFGVNNVSNVLVIRTCAVCICFCVAISSTVGGVSPSLRRTTCGLKTGHFGIF